MKKKENNIKSQIRITLRLDILNKTHDFSNLEQCLYDFDLMTKYSCFTKEYELSALRNFAYYVYILITSDPVFEKIHEENNINRIAFKDIGGKLGENVININFNEYFKKCNNGLNPNRLYQNIINFIFKTFFNMKHIVHIKFDFDKTNLSISIEETYREFYEYYVIEGNVNKIYDFIFPYIVDSLCLSETCSKKRKFDEIENNEQSISEIIFEKNIDEYGGNFLKIKNVFEEEIKINDDIDENSIDGYLHNMNPDNINNTTEKIEIFNQQQQFEEINIKKIEEEIEEEKIEEEKIVEKAIEKVIKNVEEKKVEEEIIVEKVEEIIVENIEEKIIIKNSLNKGDDTMNTEQLQDSINNISEIKFLEEIDNIFNNSQYKTLNILFKKIKRKELCFEEESEIMEKCKITKKKELTKKVKTPNNGKIEIYPISIFYFNILQEYNNIFNKLNTNYKVFLNKLLNNKQYL